MCGNSPEAKARLAQKLHMRPKPGATGTPTPAAAPGAGAAPPAMERRPTLRPRGRGLLTP